MQMIVKFNFSGKTPVLKIHVYWSELLNHVLLFNNLPACDLRTVVRLYPALVILQSESRVSQYL